MIAGASVLMKIWQSNTPKVLKEEAFTNCVTKFRSPGLLIGYDNSKLKVGTQQTKNKSGNVLSQMKVRWTNEELSKDRIRMILKSILSISF